MFKNGKPNHNKKSSFSLLPIEVLRVVLQGYLSVKDISCLDIAICNTDLRKIYLNALQSVKIRDEKESGRGDNFVSWVIKRHLKPSRFESHPRTFTRISAQKMAAGMMKLDAIEILNLNKSLGQEAITNAAMSKIVRLGLGLGLE
jgi:hypothetical protein